jgi:APA family basic amino acid/polyamine antiporter
VDVCTQDGPAVGLRGEIGKFQYLALGFGTIVGSAWVVLLGDWLRRAGPGGAILGFAAGGVAMMLIGAAYAELAARMPEAGSEFIYAHRVYGRALAFAVGWFLALFMVSIAVFDALALAWIAEILVPSWKGATLYRAVGTPITSMAIVVGVGGAILIYGLNYFGAKIAIVAHSVLTVGFLAVVLSVAAAMVMHGHLSYALPLFASVNGSPWWVGSGAIFAVCAALLYGFQSIPQTIEERSSHVSLKAIGITIVASIGTAALFFCLMISSASVSYPWQALTMTPLAIVTAAGALPRVCLRDGVADRYGSLSAQGLERDGDLGRPPADRDVALRVSSRQPCCASPALRIADRSSKADSRL